MQSDQIQHIRGSLQIKRYRFAFYLHHDLSYHGKKPYENFNFSPIYYRKNFIFIIFCPNNKELTLFLPFQARFVNSLYLQRHVKRPLLKIKATIWDNCRSCQVYRVRHMSWYATSNGCSTKMAKARSIKFFAAILCSLWQPF